MDTEENMNLSNNSINDIYLLFELQCFAEINEDMYH